VALLCRVRVICTAEKGEAPKRRALPRSRSAGRNELLDSSSRTGGAVLNGGTVAYDQGHHPRRSGSAITAREGWHTKLGLSAPFAAEGSKSVSWLALFGPRMSMRLGTQAGGGQTARIVGSGAAAGRVRNGQQPSGRVNSRRPLLPCGLSAQFAFRGRTRIIVGALRARCQ